MILFRPIGQFEYRLIEKTKFKKFPPRLYWQPIFYPVLNIEYARKIAIDWNTKDYASGYIGYVTSFEVDNEYLKKFEVHTVGDNSCQEYWIPSDELEEFNNKIIGQIEIVEIHKGTEYNENAIMPENIKTGNGINEWE